MNCDAISAGHSGHGGHGGGVFRRATDGDWAGPQKGQVGDQRGAGGSDTVHGSRGDNAMYNSDVPLLVFLEREKRCEKEDAIERIKEMERRGRWGGAADCRRLR